MVQRKICSTRRLASFSRWDHTPCWFNLLVGLLSNNMPSLSMFTLVNFWYAWCNHTCLFCIFIECQELIYGAPFSSLSWVKSFMIHVGRVWSCTLTPFSRVSTKLGRHDTSIKFESALSLCMCYGHDHIISRGENYRSILYTWISVRVKQRV